MHAWPEALRTFRASALLISAVLVTFATQAQQPTLIISPAAVGWLFHQRPSPDRQCMNLADWRRFLTIGGSGGPLPITDFNATTARRFYRVQLGQYQG